MASDTEIISLLIPPSVPRSRFLNACNIIEKKKKFFFQPFFFRVDVFLCEMVFYFSPHFLYLINKIVKVKERKE